MSLMTPELSSTSFEAYYRQQFRGVLSDAELTNMFASLCTPLPLVLRVSQRAPLADRALSRLQILLGEEVQAGQLEWVGKRAWQFSLVGRGGTHHQFLQQQQSRGALQRQESASMLPALVLAPESHHAVLDMCAAPGSKSCQLLELMQSGVHASGRKDGPSRGSVRGGSVGMDGGFLIANDASLDRVISLNHRLQSVNVASPRTMVTSLDARWWPSLGNLRFDRVLCDVPCSGDGTMRKRHRNTPEWSAAAAVELHTTQLRILREGMRLLKPGGLLVYSTCSLNPIENEAVVAAALRREMDPSPPDPSPPDPSPPDPSLLGPSPPDPSLTATERGAEFWVEDCRELVAGGLAGLHPVDGLVSWIPPKSDADPDLDPDSLTDPKADPEVNRDLDLKWQTGAGANAAAEGWGQRRSLYPPQ